MPSLNTLSALWDAQSVAVVGASDREGSLGRLPIDFLTRFGYAGRILPIRPDGEPVAGLPSHISLAAAGEATGPVWPARPLGPGSGNREIRPLVSH